MHRSSLFGNREISSLTARMGGRPASGRRGAVADDVRAGEVRSLCSSDEVGEQLWTIGGGVDGAKGGGQREHEPILHMPDTEPGKCVIGTGACTRAIKAREEGAVHRSVA